MSSQPFVFGPPANTRMEAKGCENHIPRSRKQDCQARVADHPNRIFTPFSPGPFLQNGHVQLTYWEVLGVQSFITPSAIPPSTIDSIVVDIHGASRSFTVKDAQGTNISKDQGTDKGNKTIEDNDLAYGVYFGPESVNNRGNIITDRIAWNHRHAAYMYAALVTLKKVTKILNPQAKARLYSDFNPSSQQVKQAFRMLEEAREKIKLVVIRSDTGILGYSLNKNIYRWLDRGFQTSKGVNRPGEPLLREIHELMVGLEKKGISVQFWGMANYDTCDVEDITKDLLDECATQRDGVEAREGETL